MENKNHSYVFVAKNKKSYMKDGDLHFIAYVEKPKEKSIGSVCGRCILEHICFGSTDELKGKKDARIKITSTMVFKKEEIKEANCGIGEEIIWQRADLEKVFNQK